MPDGLKHHQGEGTPSSQRTSPPILPLADFVIMTVPETPQTRGMMAAHELRLMKPTAYLINIGRGGAWCWTTWSTRYVQGRLLVPVWMCFRSNPCLPSTMDHARRVTDAACRRHRAILTGAPYRVAAGELPALLAFSQLRLLNVVDKTNWF